MLSPGRRGRWLLQRRLPEQPLLHSGWLRVVASAAFAASTTVATADSSTAAMFVADAFAIAVAASSTFRPQRGRRLLARLLIIVWSVQLLRRRWCMLPPGLG